MTQEQKDERFEQEEIPRILAAVYEARKAQEHSTITIAIAANGGLLSVIRESKKVYKG